MGEVLDLDGDDDLEPLFNYKRVQPVNLAPVVDDGSFEPFPYGLDGKKRRTGKKLESGVGKVGDGKCCVVNLDEEEGVKGLKEIEDEDWLSMPPQNVVDVKHDADIDDTLQKLRLKKMELASFAQSADSILKEVIETAKSQIMSSRATAESVDEQSKSQAEQSKSQAEQSKAHDEREKIVICIQDNDESKQFRVYKNDKLDKLFKAYAERSKLNFEKLVFCFDGDKICPGASPDSLGMDDGDMIEMHIKSC